MMRVLRPDWVASTGLPHPLSGEGPKQTLDRRAGHQGKSLIECYITDRRTLAPGETLLAAIARNLIGNVDWIQIREKDLTARDLFELTRNILALPNPRGVKILVNSRIDVALPAGASGAHLPAGSPAPLAWRSITPPGFLLGVSCHSLDEVRAAEQEGADYVLFGPVFTPLSKPAQGPPAGLAGLARAIAVAAKIPVLALGGITRANAAACIEAGAAGVAGISLYQ
jgi:thiamine-phosphate pyrophosphorylase